MKKRGEKNLVLFHTSPVSFITEDGGPPGYAQVLGETGLNR